MMFCLREYSLPFENEHFITFSGYFWVCRVPYCCASKHLASCITEYVQTHKELNKCLVICILKLQKLLQLKGHHRRRVQGQRCLKADCFQIFIPATLCCSSI